MQLLPTGEVVEGTSCDVVLIKMGNLVQWIPNIGLTGMAAIYRPRDHKDALARLIIKSLDYSSVTLTSSNRYCQVALSAKILNLSMKTDIACLERFFIKLKKTLPYQLYNCVDEVRLLNMVEVCHKLEDLIDSLSIRELYVLFRDQLNFEIE